MHIVQIGTGRVGRPTIHNILCSKLADKITVCDIKPGLAKAFAEELKHVTASLQLDVKISSCEKSDGVTEVDLILISAGKPRTPGVKMTRNDLAKQNRLKNYKLNIRIEKVIAPSYKGSKKPGTWYFIKDPNFNFVVWKLQVTKNNSFNLSNPKLIVEIDMKEYIRIMVKIFLYHISDKIFRKLVKIENYWEGNEYFGEWINRFF